MQKEQRPDANRDESGRSEKKEDLREWTLRVQGRARTSQELNQPVPEKETVDEEVLVAEPAREI